MNAPIPAPAYVSRAARRQQRARQRIAESNAAYQHQQLTRARYINGSASLQQLLSATIRLLKAGVCDFRSIASKRNARARALERHRTNPNAQLAAMHDRHSATKAMATSNLYAAHIQTLEARQCSTT